MARRQDAMDRPGRTSRERGVFAGARRGVSLVEILVVLVVLIIGMLAVMRLFPAGFANINYTGNVTEGDAFAKANEEYLRKNVEHLPDSILAISPGLPSPPYPPAPGGAGSPLTNLQEGDFERGLPYLDNPINGVGPNDPIPEDPRYNDANTARRVIGERLKVPAPTLATDPMNAVGETASLYHALFAPLYSVTPLGGASLGVQAYAGTPWQRVVLPDPPDPRIGALHPLTAPNQRGPLVATYGVDYQPADPNAAGYLYFIALPGVDRLFKFQCSYRFNNGASAANSEPTAELFIPRLDTDPATGQPLPDPSTGKFVVQRYNLTQDPNTKLARGVDQTLDYDSTTGQITSMASASPGTPPQGAAFAGVPAPGSVDPSSDLVYRALNFLPSGTAFSSDPYEFKVYDPAFGLFGFNPNAATLQLPSEQGRGLAVRIDYDVDDWHILRRDVLVPSEQIDTNNGAQPRFALSLGTGAIKKVGDTEDAINLSGGGSIGQAVDASFVYAGLIRNYPVGLSSGARAGSPNVDVVIVDLQSGFEIDSRTLGGVDNSNGEIDYAAGVIHLAPNVTWSSPVSGTAQFSPAGRQLRVYYRTYADFAVATTKPHGTYARVSELSPVKAFPANFPPGLGQNGANSPPMLDGQFYEMPFGYLIFGASDATRTLGVDYAWTNGQGGRGEEVSEPHQVQLHLPGTLVPGGLPQTQEYMNAQFAWLRLNHAVPNPNTNDLGADPSMAGGWVILSGVHGESFSTRVVWRETNRWRHMERSTVLSSLVGR